MQDQDKLQQVTEPIFNTILQKISFQKMLVLSLWVYLVPVCLLSTNHKIAPPPFYFFFMYIKKQFYVILHHIYSNDILPFPLFRVEIYLILY